MNTQAKIWIGLGSLLVVAVISYSVVMALGSPASEDDVGIGSPNPVIDNVGEIVIGPAQQLRAEYSSIGYPSAKEISVPGNGRDWAEKVLEAYFDDKLYVVQKFTADERQTWSVVSIADKTEAGYENCGIYSNGLCLVLDTNKGHEKIVGVFSADRNNPNVENGWPVIKSVGPFATTTRELIVELSSGDAGHYLITANVLNTTTLDFKKFISTTVDSALSLEAGTDAMTINFEGGSLVVDIDWSETKGGIVTYDSVTFNDASGELLILTGPWELPVEGFADLDYDAILKNSGQIFFTTVEGRYYRYDPKSEPRLILIKTN